MNTIQKNQVGIAGAAGYTGGELLRILLNHPHVEIAWAHSRSHLNEQVAAAHTDLLGETNLCFSNPVWEKTDIVFLCMGHGESKKYLLENSVPDHIRIIDLSQDFRLDDSWIYGLPEMNRDSIRKNTKHIANPGCFATTIQLALLPLAENRLLNDDIHVSAITGSTGAGQAPSQSTHFSWRSHNISNYKSFEHQHLAEIGRSLSLLQPESNHRIQFIPYRGGFTRGILASIYTPIREDIQKVIDLYNRRYESHPFVWVSPVPIDVKQVVNTNKCFLYLEKHGEMLLITSITDNLLKGASGQAVQNMNLLMGCEETAGLRLKSTAF